METIFNQKILTGIVVSLLLLSVLCQIMIGILYQNMIKETDNMTTTENTLLKQCKLKFVNCYQLHSGVTNIPVFVEKFINRVRFGGVTLTSIGHLAGQLMLLSVFVAGIGVCQGIIAGNSVGSLLPYYIVSLFGLYVYFSVSSLVDAEGKKKILTINLIDYLENNMLGHLQLAHHHIMEDIIERENPKTLEEKVAMVSSSQPKEKTFIKNNIFSKSEEQELEELLKEFLA